MSNKIKSEKKMSSKRAKRKLNLKNYKSTNPFIIHWLFAFRIISVIILILYPIALTLTIAFDDGAKNYMLYVVFSLPESFRNIFTFGTETVSESSKRLVPFISYLIIGLLMLLLYFLPFFSASSKKSKGYLSFHYMFLSAIGFALIYANQFYLIKILPHFPLDIDPVANIDKIQAIYWQDLSNTFSFYSFWMIVQQIFHGITFVFGVWCAIESDLIRRGKLVYNDLIVKYDLQNSLANKVLGGQLEFGNTSDENLKLSIKKLKSKLNIESAMAEDRVNYVDEAKSEIDKNDALNDNSIEGV